MRVLLVEDEPDLGAAIQRTLTQEAYIVDWAKDGREAWGYLESQWTQYTLAIFDWLLPGLSGIDLCQRLRAQQSPLPVLMLTAKDQPEDTATGLDAGADDYLVKPFRKIELLARLRALQRRSPHFQPQQLQVGPLTLDYGTHNVSILNQEQGQSVLLTHKEFQLLEYFMQHPRQIVSRDQILNQLWGAEADTISNVVAALMRQLRRKLAELGCDDAIETVYGVGYRLHLTHE
ncbi:two-component system response regulator RppA [Acaryochloris marina]|uniref:Two-component transcriptional regulator n=1 Tax=Acaryochloris marina (strain MBIC 11017) TaxID=329726 RepID=B0C155_ACAM1|nr:two-component system response regulator RppA [Acaryochloris marina]ABW28453.1 two-component transcriptional regulator [Acaryochloris marina MBIC11017]BDM77456.1 DNA-binding response regulator [Acaryochloris marina MBIC10699]